MIFWIVFWISIFFPFCILSILKQNEAIYRSYNAFKFIVFFQYVFSLGLYINSVLRIRKITAKGSDFELDQKLVILNLVAFLT
jgi:hypothetical protein